MAATLINADGIVMGIPNDEAGMNIEQVTINAAGKVIEIPNKSGNTRTVYIHDKKKEIELSGETTGAITVTIGGSLVFNNDEDLGGIVAGMIVVKELSLTLGRESAKKLSIKATQYEDMVSGE